MVNQAYARMHGYQSSDDIMALPDIRTLFLDEDLEVSEVRASQILCDQLPDLKLRFKNRRKDGSVLWVELVERKVSWNDQDAIQTTLIDVSEQVLMEEKLTFIAMTDALTGLFNRRFLMEKSATLFHLQKATQQALSCILIDLDEFKRINDNYGHSVGDDVLKAFSRRCQGLVSDPNFLGRYGGEEFLIIVPDSADSDVLTLAESIRLICSNEPFKTRAGDFKVTISAGISCLLPTDNRFDQLIERADKQLYLAKKSGRNKVLGLP